VALENAKSLYSAASQPDAVYEVYERGLELQPRGGHMSQYTWARRCSWHLPGAFTRRSAPLLGVVLQTSLFYDDLLYILRVMSGILGDHLIIH
jgi:hypothetical protein